MHFAKSLVAREYHQRLNEQGRGGGSKTGEGSSVLAHGLNIARNPFELFTFAQNWVRKRVLAERKLPSVFLLNSTRRYPMEINSEQFPERESRISLSDRVDRYGMPLINLNWHVGGDTLDGLRRAFQLFASTVEQSKIGHYTYQESEIETNFVPQGGHHIGTTRMAERAEDGVVDSNCTVFGVANLHIAGASVFTTSSCANPTLMGVAMALRLADHLKEKMTS
jgi:choline dehydrogenase-like flavoprotein